MWFVVEHQQSKTNGGLLPVNVGALLEH
jgi:hypothetical protein